MTLDERVQKELDAATVHAGQGNALFMISKINLAKRYAKGADISAQIAQIERIGYRKAVPREFAAAWASAYKGNAQAMESHLALAKRFAGSVKPDISALVEHDIKQVEQTGYNNAVTVQLDAAIVSANKGDASDMDDHLQAASKYAKMVATENSADVDIMDISALVAIIARAGYRKAVPILLKSAEIYAGKGNYSVMDASLQAAERYAEMARMNISAEVVRIRAQAEQIKTIRLAHGVR